jgi:hypothetical protein
LKTSDGKDIGIASGLERNHQRLTTAPWQRHRIRRSPPGLTVEHDSTVPDADLISIAQRVLLNTLSVDEGAIGTVQINEYLGSLSRFDPGVPP